MSDVSISYKGAEIAALDDSGTKTLLTSGKYCEDDISVVYTKPSGGGSQGLIDLVVNYTDSGNRTWTGVVEGNAIKNFSTSTGYLSVPLVLKQPVVVSPGDIITMTLSNVDTPSAFYADFNMHRVCVAEGVAGGDKVPIATNFLMRAGETSKSLTYSGDAVMIWSFGVNSRTGALNLSYADVHIDINNTRLF